MNIRAMRKAALLSAAFTVPERCLVIVHKSWPEAVVYFVAMTALAIVALVSIVAAGLPREMAWMVIWLAAGHVAWFILLVLSRSIAETILVHEAVGNNGDGGDDREDGRAV